MKNYVRPRLSGKSNASRLQIEEAVRQLCKEQKSCKDCPIGKMAEEIRKSV